MKITSSNNKWIKDIRKFKTKKGRRQHKVFVAEGLRFLRSLLELDAEIEVVLYSDDFYEKQLKEENYKKENYKENDNLSSVNIFDENVNRKENFINFLIGNLHLKNKSSYFKCPVLEVSNDVLNPLFDTETPQGIIAVAKQKKWTWDDLFFENKPLIVLDRLQDPGNMGTIIRTADCAGMGGIVLLKGCVDIYNDKILRSTMGAISAVPIIDGVDWDKARSMLLDKGYNIYKAVVYSANYYDKVDFNNSPSAIIIGNEANGIADDILSDDLITPITIPNMGRMESLNASVAASVIMYEMLRQSRG